jgi:F-type H+-transporting ATPase subunit epsilon
MPIDCSVVTQDKLLFEGPADMVVVPGTDGEMGILPHHAPLLSSLNYGVVRVRVGTEEHAFAIAGGIVEVRPEAVTVLADVGEEVDEIDIGRAEAAKSRAEELLKAGPPPDTDEYLAIEAALRRSTLRLEAVRRYRRSRRPFEPGEGGPR